MLDPPLFNIWLLLVLICDLSGLFYLLDCSPVLKMKEVYALRFLIVINIAFIIEVILKFPQ